LSGLLCIALLSGGLMVLMLDLGRPERIIVAATHYNFTSVFAWNVVLYSGMVGIVVVYLWTMFERRFNAWSKPAGIAALVWRFVLTTGTGSIFGFLVARQAYQSALLAPLFIVLSFGWGLAVFLIVQVDDVPLERPPSGAARSSAAWHGCSPSSSARRCTWWHRVSPDQPVLRAARPFEAFILRGNDGGIYPLLFWGGYVLLGSVAPMVLLFHPGFRGDSAARWPPRCWWCWVRVRVALRLHHRRSGFPLEIFPGLRGQQQFGDGAVAALRAFRGPSSCSGHRRSGRRLRADGDRGRARAGLHAAGRLIAAAKAPCDCKVPICPPAGLGRAQVVGQDHHHARPGGCAGRAGHWRAALQEGPRLHRPDVAVTGRGPQLLQPRPLPDGPRHGARARPSSAAVRGAELALVEGNKGLYDGLALDGSNSNAGLARRLGLPVLLVHRLRAA
jgi:hypothetical protein